MARKTVLFIAVATIALAGCAKKRPEVLPPAPTQDTQPVQPQQPPRGDGIVPGSADDFVRRVTSDRIHFGFDNYDIDAESARILDSQAAWLLQYPNVHVTIEGHCDERGTREYNLALGDRRANSAKNYLAGKGIAAARITTISYGKERPIAQGSDEASWAQNRRAVTVVVR
jgi:peptidoglycan-associated lipoprotein